MTVAIDHKTSAPQVEETATNIRTMIQPHTLPAPMQPLPLQRGKNGCKTFCVWEADSAQSLKGIVGSLTA
jgi:hypothetical protein